MFSMNPVSLTYPSTLFKSSTRRLSLKRYVIGIYLTSLSSSLHDLGPASPSPPCLTSCLQDRGAAKMNTYGSWPDHNIIRHCIPNHSDPSSISSCSKVAVNHLRIPISRVTRATRHQPAHLHKTFCQSECLDMLSP